MKSNFWLKFKSPAKGGQAILALAPMAGITDSAFRQICRLNGADIVYSEMASISALFFKPQKTLALVRFNKKERPYVVQLFGKDPIHFAKAAKIITEKVKPDGIDINFGCPAKKVFGHGSGCALMPQKKLAREIITAVCENTNLPISIKIRAGVNPVKYAKGDFASQKFNGARDTTAIDFIKNVKDLPFAAVMIHGRTYEGGFSGPVDFKIIEKIKKIIPDKIVLANGGINTPEQALEILKKYPAIDGLGIARGAWGRPFIFNEIKDLLVCHCEHSEATPSQQIAKRNINSSELKKEIATVISRQDSLAMTNKYDFNRIKKIMLKHAELIWQDKKELGMFEIRKHLAWYVKGFPGAAGLRRQLVQAKSVKEIKTILK